MSAQLRLASNTIGVADDNGNPVGTIRSGQWTRGGDYDPKSIGIDYAVATTPDGRQTKTFETSPNAGNNYSSTISAVDLAVNFLREVSYGQRS